MAARMVTGEITVNITAAKTARRVTKSLANVCPVIRVFTDASVMSRVQKTVMARVINGQVSVTSVSKGSLGCCVIGYVPLDAAGVHGTAGNAPIVWTDIGVCFVT